MHNGPDDRLMLIKKIKLLIAALRNSASSSLLLLFLLPCLFLLLLASQFAHKANLTLARLSLVPDLLNERVANWSELY